MLLPNRLCRMEPREGNPKEIPFTFDEMRERAESEVHEVPHFCGDTDEVEYEEEPVDPWEEIDYSGVWEETLAQCWQLHKVRRNLPDDFEWRYLRVLRDFFSWFRFRDEIAAHLRTKIPKWEAKAWKRHNANRAVPPPKPQGSVQPARRPKRGSRPDTENHFKVADIVRPYGDTWKDADTLDKICSELDAAKVPPSKAWSSREPSARSWERAAGNYPDLVIKAIEYRLKRAQETSESA